MCCPWTSAAFVMAVRSGKCGGGRGGDGEVVGGWRATKTISSLLSLA